jgi:hypothetical protein
MKLDDTRSPTASPTTSSNQLHPQALLSKLKLLYHQQSKPKPNRRQLPLPTYEPTTTMYPTTFAPTTMIPTKVSPQAQLRGRLRKG